jgi:hypothetical protein
LLAHGRWFSPGTPSSSTTKTDRHDRAEILLKVVLKHQSQNCLLNFFLVAPSRKKTERMTKTIAEHMPTGDKL